MVTDVPCCCHGRGTALLPKAPAFRGQQPRPESPEGGRSRRAVRGGWFSPAHAVPDPAAAPRWEPQPLSFQELQSERSELPVSRLLEETALGRPGKEDSGTGTPGRPHVPLLTGGWR